jgi:subtilisin
VLISCLLREGQGFTADERKKIVMVSTSSDFEQLLGVLLDDALQHPLTGIKVVYNLSMINAVALTLSPDKTVPAGLAYLQNLLSQIPSVVYGVYDDLPFSVLPITPALPGQVPLQETYDWGLVRIGVDVAHQQMPQWKGHGVTVAIVDTGIDCGHPDLPLLLGGVNAVPGEASYCDDHGHGTHVAGIIAARANNAGLLGAAPEASLVAVKVLNKVGQGYLSNLLFGVQWIWWYNNFNQNKIQLVNMSLGFSVDSLPLKTAIEKLFDNHGTIMVAAAGNSCPSSGDQDEGGGDEGQGICTTSPTTILYPAAYAEVLAVTATNAQNQITYYSLAGPAVDVTAPGGERNTQRILSTYLGGLYGFASGTSQAAAHVTGALALKLQQQPALTLDEIQLQLAHTAMHLQYPATQQGRGLIQAACLLAPTLPQCPPH